MFTQRVFHQNIVFVLGPEANHHLLVSNASNYEWRTGHYGDLMPLLGDGMLAIDGAFHRLSRKAMLPMFHRERIAQAIDAHGARRSTARSTQWQDGTAARPLPLDPRARAADRDARAVRPRPGRGRARRHGINPADEFENALSFWSKDYILQVLRGPGSPWSKMRAAAKRLDSVIYAEINRRRDAERPRRRPPRPPARHRPRRGRRASP